MRTLFLLVLPAIECACGGMSSGASGGLPIDAGPIIPVVAAPDARPPVQAAPVPASDASQAAPVPASDTSPPAEGPDDASCSNSVQEGFETAGDVAAWTFDPVCTTLDASPSCAPYTYLSAVSTITFDPAVGDPLPAGDPGSMEIQIPFNGYSQQADFQRVFACPIDLSGRTLFVRLMVDSGFTQDPSYPGGFVLSVRTGTGGGYASTPYINWPSSFDRNWLEIDLELSRPPFVALANAESYDPTQVVAIGLHIDTGSGPVGTGPAPNGVPAPAPATFHVDTVGTF
jgi:hypothetical protein